MTARDNILARIRAAQGKPAVAGADEHAAVERCIAAREPGPQPKMDWEPVARFRERAVSLASTFDEVSSLEKVPAAIANFLKSNSLPLNAVCWPELRMLDWQGAGIAVEARPARGQDLVGITGCFCAVAETGTLVLLSGPDTPAAASLVPETHVAVVAAARIMRSMEEAWQLLRKERGAVPRAVNFVSGPSRTADIEQTVTLGAHGPYRVHIVLVNSER